MRGIAPLQGRAHAITLDGLHKNDCRAILTLTGSAIRGVELFRVLPTALDLRHLDVGERIHKLL